MGSWCTKLSNYMGGWCLRKLNSMGGWVKKKKCRLPHPCVFSGIALKKIRFSEKLYNFMHFERYFAFKNA